MLDADGRGVDEVGDELGEEVWGEFVVVYLWDEG